MTQKPMTVFARKSAAIAALFAAALPTALPRPAVAQRNDFGMGPPATAKIVADADAAVKKPIPPGPVAPTWQSIADNYRAPAWFSEAKFGVFMHWGVYAVPAYHNEWEEKHMYGNDGIRDWHVKTYGPLDTFGYKDFIPLFTCAKFDPDAWAELFQKAGARFVVPTAQHHDNFALWDSDLTHIDAKEMGPKRDLIGDLARAVRKKGMKFGVSNHGIENFTFINPPPAVTDDLKAKKVDLYDPKWNDIYHVADRGDAATTAFLTDWVNRNEELIDKYQPDMLWFDNGVNSRFYDPLKRTVAAYYYNRAKTWNKEVSISTKSDAYAPSRDDRQQIGSIVDFEKIGSRSPAGIRTGQWQVDEPIGSTWGYTKTMRIAGPGVIVGKLVDTVSKNGTLLLNLSPMADGTIPQEQQNTLLGIGDWLRVNGEAIYGTHNWTQFKDSAPSAPRPIDVRFTVKGSNLYAILLPYKGEWPGAQQITLPAVALGSGMDGKVKSVSLLGATGTLAFQQEADGLKVTLPANAPCQWAYTLKITGLTMNPCTVTRDGNPIKESNGAGARQSAAAVGAPPNAPVAARTGRGISGPGAPLPAGARPTVRTRPTANTAVTQGILPPIRPLLDLHIRDTEICVGGDNNYYLTGSTGDDIWKFNDGVELWRSSDLKNWNYLGLVWSVAKNGTWEKEPRDLHGKPTVTVWAPEIHYLKKQKTYVICLSMAPGGISLLKSVTGKPEGPYVNTVPNGKPLRGGIDPTIFEDDDGSVYFASGAGGTISRLKDDLSGFAEVRTVALENPDHNPAHHAAKVVQRGMNGFGHEGAVLFKANGKYYHGAVDNYAGRYSSCVAVSDTIWGPYRLWHETVPCGGGTNFFQDKENRWWCAFFGNDDAAPWREMPGIVRVEFDKDGKISVAKQPDFVLQSEPPKK